MLKYKMLWLAVLQLFLLIPALTWSATPLWTVKPLTETTVDVPSNGKVTVQYRVTNHSTKRLTLILSPIKAVTQNTTGTGICPAPIILPSNESCILSLEINGSVLTNSINNGPIICNSGNLNQCYQAKESDRLHVQRTIPHTGIISVNPTALSFSDTGTGVVTITNEPVHSVTAFNINEHIPAGSSIYVANTTCGSSLAIGASCTITFGGTTPEGPTTISIAGDNTNTVNVDATVVSAPTISITGPVQQSRVVNLDTMTSLNLVISNDAASSVNANNITVTDETACPNLTVDDTDCTSVSPGSSCTLLLTSNTPYAPCTLTVSGSNTANSLQPIIAFYYLGGLVFEATAGSGKIVIDQAYEFTNLWTRPLTNISGALSNTDGVTNTDSIVADSSCTNYPSYCSAHLCRAIGSAWYLPAKKELVKLSKVLCLNWPCNFGGFRKEVYWSSTQANFDDTVALNVSIPGGGVNDDFKNFFNYVRCIRTFP